MANQLLINSGDKTPELTIEQTISGYFLNRDLSDVCFLVGDERAKIYAHRFILATGSEVFKAMFYGELKETRNEIEVPDLTLIGFRNMIKYFYTKKIEIDLSEVHVTYLAANKYLVLGLIENLTAHIIKNCSNVANVCLAYDQLLKLEIGDSLGDAEIKIAAALTEVCASESFMQIDENTLVSILKFSTLNISEVELLKACMRWADGQVGKQENSEADSIQASKRATFEPIKHLIRFGDLSLADLSSVYGLESFLTVEEVGSIFLQLAHHCNSIQIDYRSPRGPRKVQVARAFSLITGKLNFDSSGVASEEFTLTVNRNVLITSMRTFAGTNFLSLKFEAFSESGEKTLSIEGRTVTGQRNDDSVCWLIDLNESNFALKSGIAYKCCLLFTLDYRNRPYLHPYLPPAIYPNALGLTGEMTLKHEGGTVFKIDNFCNLHCIESIDFWPC